MKRRSPQNNTASQQNRRAAFTLIELMIAIVIILILLGLLIPAIGAVRLRAQQAQVRTEIGNLEAAITAFKADFGMDPPSGITLYENQAGWNSDTRSKNLIRGMWPQFDFSKNRDINRDSDSTDSFTLNAGECLVFFLGGIWDSTNKTPNGFSKNPADPFIVSTAGGGRLGPYYEFNISRFVDIDNDNAPEYLDSFPSQQKPYLYFSSYDGRGYRIADEVVGTGMLDVYRQGTDPTVTPPTNDVPFKAKSFQIISPGADFQYGTGGIYNPDKNFPANRTEEVDNITNFVSGSLK
ncbi:MAG: prepilin-type N-terminal cleavage/methylation domain-containing protein [Planctomycetaceae bacterium]|nr:prepilin-type N-terminal cleavage/methylation domain-containing protein [Planctomycetaceae bacterium]